MAGPAETTPTRILHQSGGAELLIGATSSVSLESASQRVPGAGVLGQPLATKVQSIDGAGRRRTCVTLASSTGSNPTASQKRGAAAEAKALQVIMDTSRGHDASSAEVIAVATPRRRHAGWT